MVMNILILDIYILGKWFLQAYTKAWMPVMALPRMRPASVSIMFRSFLQARDGTYCEYHSDPHMSE